MSTAMKLFMLLAALLPVVSLAQVHDVLCKEGNASFEASLQTAVTISIGPQKANGFSTRSCQATLSWNKQTLALASGVPVLDLDMFGPELSPGISVVAIAIAKVADRCCMTYKICSLTKTPQLLRTITGGGFFEAADTDLDGDVEIWTDDSAAVDGFEGLTTDEIEFVPALVLRLEHGLLLDASAEFTAFFDDVIKRVRSKINPDSLGDFRASNGRLQASPDSTAQE